MTDSEVVASLRAARERRCQCPTDHLQTCSRPARYLWVSTEAIVWAACRQHARSDRGRMFAPRPWGFSHVIDLASGITLADGRIR